jgi:signal transduction histidine kinase
MKTLQKRVRVMDPLSTAARQTKERFDLVRWTRDVVTSHESQFRRHEIAWSVQVEPAGGPKTLSVKAVRGMIVQVLENLLSNSVYWLKQEKMAHPDFRPEVRVVVDTAAKEIRVTDNGPGVAPAVAEEVFQPFVTTKPPHLGKGLGLYIAREIATYHKGDLSLDPRRTIHEKRLNTFVFSLGEAAR